MRNYLTTFLFIYFIISNFIVSGCQTADAQNKDAATKITLFAAAGTRRVADAISDDYTAQRGVTVERNYASSGTLARQLASGAHADMYISANKQWIDFLLEKRRLDPASVAPIATTSLVLIAPTNARIDPVAFTPQTRIKKLVPRYLAIGDPAHVPVGKYAAQALAHLGWDAALGTEKLVRAKDVSTVLQYVAIGECDLGIVYRSEAVANPKVKIVGTFPADSHPTITFYAARVIADRHADTSLLKHFTLSARPLLKKHGFTPLTP